eukprot:UN08433
MFFVGFLSLTTKKKQIHVFCRGSFAVQIPTARATMIAVIAVEGTTAKNISISPHLPAFKAENVRIRITSRRNAKLKRREEKEVHKILMIKLYIKLCIPP